MKYLGLPPLLSMSLGSGKNSDGNYNDADYKDENYKDEHYNDAKEIKTCWTWVPVGSALKIHACPAPGDHDDGGDLVDDGLNDDDDSDLVDDDLHDVV